MMKVFQAYLSGMEDPEHRARTTELIAWVKASFPVLEPRLAWNQPMFTDHGTFIIGFSVAKNHLAVAPERAGILHFSAEIERAGYDHGKQLIRIPWSGPVDRALLERIIQFNISTKKDCATFWRK